jgi:hypothetical protein
MKELHQLTFREVRQSHKDWTEIKWIARQLAQHNNKSRDDKEITREAAQLSKQWRQAPINPLRPLGPALELARRALRETPDVEIEQRTMKP